MIPRGFICENLSTYSRKMIRREQAQEARQRYKEMAPVLDEQSRRRFAALEAKSLGRGGVSLMARITGLARRTIYRGLHDIARVSTPSCSLPRLRQLMCGKKLSNVGL